MQIRPNPALVGFEKPESGTALVVPYSNVSVRLWHSFSDVVEAKILKAVLNVFFSLHHLNCLYLMNTKWYLL